MRLIDADALMENYGLKDATKYGNKDAEQQEHSYSTLMLYEIADIIEDAPTVEAKPVEWIPCSERLPELTEGTEYFKQSECCLVALKWWDGDITESVGWYNESGLWSDDGKNCKVIAWMPLPTPYNAERGGKNE